MFQGKIKKSEKLPRGSFLYIRVGDRLYAGESATIQVTKNPQSKLRKYEKPTGARSWHYGCGSPTQMERNLANYYSKRDGRKVPEYWIKPDQEPDPTKQSVTGHTPILTDEFKDVKQFRRLNQAELACERLKAMYAGLDIKCVIELHEGDK